MKEIYTLAECELKHKCNIARVLAQQINDINSGVYFYDVKQVLDEETCALTRYYFDGYWKKTIEDTRKNIETTSAWNIFEQTKYVHIYDEDDFDYFVDNYSSRMYSSNKDANYWEQYDVLKDSVDMTNYINTECEIQEHEKLLDLPFKSDNDIAFETYEEMRHVGHIRQLAIIAYNKGINTLTVIRFMREKLANDTERGIFLEQYASAGFWDGYESNSDY